MPRFSIVIPCYNVDATLTDTIAAILEQSFEDFEVICIDDRSTDQTRRVLNVCAEHDSRIKIAVNNGIGPSDARNLGALKLARGEIIAFCDADDIWAPEKLAQLDQAFTEPSVDAAFGRVGFFNTDPNEIGAVSTVPEGPLTIEMLLGENAVCTMSNIAVRKAAFDRTGGFDRDIVHNEDLDWLIRLCGSGARVISLPELQVYYRMSPGGLSSDLAAMEHARCIALASAARFGIVPDRANHAVHLRYLARRALRLGISRTAALRYTTRGLWQSPRGFLTPLRRGGLTGFAAVAAVFLPLSLRRRLFAN